MAQARTHAPNTFLGLEARKTCVQVSVDSTNTRADRQTHIQKDTLAE